MLAPDPGRSESGEPGESDKWLVLSPVTERGEVIGLLEFVLPEEPSADSVAEIARLAHLLAFVVIANRRHTDLYEWGQRTRPLSLSAEIQHRLLPGPQTCEAGAFTLAGWLEPAAGIAGDTFDFSLARDVLHLSLTDAMGHGVAAALTATLCVGSLRNARQEGGSLIEQVAAANTALVEHAANLGLEDFVTGLAGRIDLRTGEMDLVNAAHVSPYLARGGHVRALELPVDLPLGLFADTTYRTTRLVLEPGDRVVFVTDGMLERNADGVDLPAEITSHDRPAPTGGGARPGRPRAPRDRARPQRRRHHPVCGLARRTRTGPRQCPRSRPAPDQDLTLLGPRAGRGSRGTSTYGHLAVGCGREQRDYGPHVRARRTPALEAPRCTCHPEPESCCPRP